ncbi:MAG: M48 family metalloprotease [Chloroflexota bacterium]
MNPNLRRGQRQTYLKPRSRSGVPVRLLIAGALVLFAVISYMGKREVNPVTGESQVVSLSPQEEIQMGLQAAPEMVKQHGGMHPDQRLQDLVDRVGWRLVESSIVKDTPYQYDFHLLADARLVNAFALPGGQTFITYALLSRLENEDQLAGVMGHEIAHVVARHSAQRMAKSELTQGILGAIVTGTGSQSSAQMAAMVGQMINMKYGRDDELESDKLGICWMIDAGYDPIHMAGVMRILQEASGGGGGGQPEFMSTHPSPDNRIQQIEATIQNANTICNLNSDG